MNKTLIARMRKTGKARRRKELAYMDSIYKRREVGSYSQKFQNRDEDILAIAEDFSDLIENANKRLNSYV